MAAGEKIVEFPKSGVGEWVPIEDDGCRWILDLPGGPFAVLPCDRDGSSVEISSSPDFKHHKVECPKCGKRTPEVMGGQFLDALKLWNKMVGGGEGERASQTS